MSLKLILRADVDNLGRLGDIVTVKPGYGRNYLIPQGLAMPATGANLKVFEVERKKLQHKIDAIRGAAQSIADKIKAVALSIPVRVGEGDKLYGSVTRAGIAQALNKAMGVADDAENAVDRRKILLEEPIRALGEYTISIKLHPDVTVEMTCKVVRADAEVAKAASPAPAEAAKTETAPDAGPEA
jgi:large subunit ribosomal protein L9